MDKNIIISLPLVDQHRDTEDDNWKIKSCGVCIAKMLMAFKKNELRGIPIMTLIHKGLDFGGYLEGIGWRHQALVDLAGAYGINLRFQKEFFRTFEEKEKGMNLIDQELELGRPVAVSIYRDFNTTNGAHLVIVNGLRQTANQEAMYHIQDPDHRDRGNNFYVSRAEFIQGWRGGMIWFT